MSSKGWWKRAFSAALIGGAVGCVAWGAAPPSEKPGWPWNSPGGGPYDLFVADVDYNGDLEVVFTAFESPSYWLYVLNHDGTVLPSFPIAGTFVNWPVSLADVDGDGRLEILVTEAGPSDWGNVLTCYRYDGTVLWTKTASCCTRAFRTPAIADVDLDGTLDVFAFAGATNPGQLWLLDNNGNAMPGWPIFWDSSAPSRDPVLSDIDGDGDLEILMSQAQTGNIWAWHHDAAVVSGYPLSILEGEFRIADMEGDGPKEMTARSFGIVVRNLDGTIRPGWPQPQTPSPIPPLCDVGNDGFLGMAFAMMNDTTPDCSKGGGLSYRYNYDGTIPVGWPVCNGNFSSGDQTLIGDTDGDGQLNFINGMTEGSFTPAGKFSKPDG
jgi:hypothetical protein